MSLIYTIILIIVVTIFHQCNDFSVRGLGQRDDQIIKVLLIVASSNLPKPPVFCSKKWKNLLIQLFIDGTL